jgi:hypothetical protein
MKLIENGQEFKKTILAAIPNRIDDNFKSRKFIVFRKKLLFSFKFVSVLKLFFVLYKKNNLTSAIVNDMDSLILK